MTKPELEFFDTETVAWTPIAEQPGAHERVLAEDPVSGMLTRLVHWEPGFDTRGTGPVSHDYFEEVLLLSGSIHDLTLDRTFGAGHYASRPSGMRHGPWTTSEGAVMFEIRYEADPPAPA